MLHYELNHFLGGTSFLFDILDIYYVFIMLQTGYVLFKLLSGNCWGTISIFDQRIRASSFYLRSRNRINHEAIAKIEL